MGNAHLSKTMTCSFREIKEKDLGDEIVVGFSWMFLLVLIIRGHYIIEELKNKNKPMK